jgi:selenocysteine-specific elongation factor
MNIPLAHTQGGEVTGSIDESVRHAITKLAHLHFPATELAREKSPAALSQAELHSRLAIDASEIVRAANALAEDGKLMATGDGGWVGGDATSLLERQALELVATHHEAHPFEPGLKLQTLRDKLRRAADKEAAALVLDRLCAGDEPRMVILANDVRMTGFDGPAEGSAAAEQAAAANTAIEGAGLAGLTLKAFSEGIGCDPKTGRALLAMLVRQEAAIETASIWFASGSVQALEGDVAAHFAKQPTLSVQDFKQITGLGRKQSIPLLEHLDRQRVTRREGDDRVKA